MKWFCWFTYSIFHITAYVVHWCDLKMHMQFEFCEFHFCCTALTQFPKRIYMHCQPAKVQIYWNWNWKRMQCTRSTHMQSNVEFNDTILLRFVHSLSHWTFITYEKYAFRIGFIFCSYTCCWSLCEMRSAQTIKEKERLRRIEWMRLRCETIFLWEYHSMSQWNKSNIF